MLFNRTKNKTVQGQAWVQKQVQDKGFKKAENSGVIKPKRKKKTAKTYAVELIVKIAFTAAAVWALCSFVIGIHINHSNSSYPMIKDGDLCITCRLSSLRQGDTIVYRREGEVKIGRIAAKSDDEVEIKNGCVTVGGYSILEDVVYSTTDEGSLIEYPYTVPKNSVFVLNDFRSDAADSRSFGAVALSDVEGKVVFLIRRRGI